MKCVRLEQLEYWRAIWTRFHVGQVGSSPSGRQLSI